LKEQFKKRFGTVRRRGTLERQDAAVAVAKRVALMRQWRKRMNSEGKSAKGARELRENSDADRLSAAFRCGESWAVVGPAWGEE